MCLPVTIVDDTIMDGFVAFTVTLTIADPDVMLGNSMTIVTITDDETGEEG